MNEERNERPQRRPQQGGRPAPARRPAAPQQGSRPASARRPAATQQESRPASARRPAAPQQRTRSAAAAPQRRPAQKKVKRNYTRLYILIGAFAAILLLCLGIWKLKGRDSGQSGTKNASSSSEMTTTTTTEPIVTEPPIVQQITFDTPSMYSVGAGAELTDVSGDQKMRVLAPQGTDNAEIVFDLAQMVGTARIADIRKISMDITCTANGPIGQVSSSLRALTPVFNAETGVQEGSKPVKVSDILLIDNESASNTWHVEVALPKGMFTAQTPQLSFVRYPDSAQPELYLDNIELLDGYGNPIDITYNAPGAQTGANTVPPTDTTTALPDMTTTIPQ